MKKILFTFGVVFMSTFAFAQNNVQDLLDMYTGQEEVNVISVSGDMIRFASNFLGDTTKETEAAIKMSSQVDELNIINTETKAKGKELGRMVNKLIDSKKYEELMTVNSEGDEVVFYGLLKNEKIKEFFILVGDGEDTTLISMSGSIDPEQVGQLMGSSY